MTILTIALTFFWGVGSLFLVAVKTNSVKTVLLKKPSILIGDFLILPTIAGTIANSTKTLSDLFSETSVWLILAASFLITIVSALRNKQLHLLWLPHLAFYWFMSFIILSFLAIFELSLVWWIVLIGVIVHQLLGIVYAKKFPEVGNGK